MQIYLHPDRFTRKLWRENLMPRVADEKVSDSMSSFSEQFPSLQEKTVKKICRSLVTVPLLFVMTTAAFAGENDMPLTTPTPSSSTVVETTTSDSTDTSVSDTTATTLTELAVIISQSLPLPF